MLVLKIYGIIALLALLVYLVRKYWKFTLDMKNKHVVISGGSSGLGLAMAQEALDRGASHVTLLARGEKALNAASESLKKDSNQKVHTFTCDVSDSSSVEAAFVKITEIGAPIDFLFPNAGFALPGLMDTADIKSYSNHISVNYLGAANVTKYALPLLKKGSHITFSGSVCSLLSFSGYSAYAPSKYALKGLADTMRNELKQQGIKIHISYISPMDTPGFKKENEVKPEACMAIEGTATVFTPKQIAQHILKGIAMGDYCIIMEPLVWFINEMSYGVSDQSNIFLQLLIAPFIPLIRFGTRIYIDTLAKTQSSAPKAKKEI